MIERLRRSHVVSLKTAADTMAMIAIQTLVTIVFGVTKADPERTGHLAGPPIATGFMTHAAGGNIPRARFHPWTVTFEALRVSVEPRWNCHCHTATRGSMATGARLVQRSMTRVIESHVETA